MMTSEAFSAAAGARPLSAGHPRVAIVVTDGMSAYGYRSKTITAAMRAHEADITMFAVGKYTP